MFLGMGVVGQSLLNIILKEKIFDLEDIFAADLSRESLDYFVELGGKKENTILFEMNSKTYMGIFEYLNRGDYFLCLADGNDYLELVTECSERGIHFISASDDTFDDVEDEESFRYLDHFIGYKKLSESSKGLATSVLQYGVNPGFVSTLTKKALIEIVDKDEGVFVKQNKSLLKELIRKNDFPKLAQELGVKAFIEADLDTTQADINEDIHTVYSTWNVPDFDAEMDDRTIISVGTKEQLSSVLSRIGATEDQIFYFNRENGLLVMNLTGKQLKAEAFSGDDYFMGCVDAHEEVLTIHDYYTLINDRGEIEYSPTVMFIYKPCNLAIDSVNHGDNKYYRLITMNEMLSGGESVGIVVEGENFAPIYVGTAISYVASRFETPSVLLVSASLLAAIKYIKEHPNEGVLFPEFLDAEEMLGYAKDYLPILTRKVISNNGNEKIMGVMPCQKSTENHQLKS